MQRTENDASRFVDIFEGDVAQQSWQAPVVIQPETELFGCQEELANPLVGFEHPRDRADQRLARVLELGDGGASPAKLGDFRVDGLERPLDVCRIDTGADDERPLQHPRFKGAVRVVRHPLALADVVGQPSTQAELTKNVVHHPVAVVPGIEAPDCRKAVADVGLRLSGHPLANDLPAPGHGWGGMHLTVHGPSAPALEQRSGGVHCSAWIDITNNRQAQRSRLEVPSMKLDQLLPPDAVEGCGSALEAPAIRVIRPIKRLYQRIDAAHGRIVIVLANRGDCLDPPLIELSLGEQRLADDVSDERKQVVHVFGEAVAGDGEHVAGGRDAKRDAPVVERIGDLDR